MADSSESKDMIVSSYLILLYVRCCSPREGVEVVDLQSFALIDIFQEIEIFTKPKVSRKKLKSSI